MELFIILITLFWKCGSLFFSSPYCDFHIWRHLSMCGMTNTGWPEPSLSLFCVVYLKYYWLRLFSITLLNDFKFIVNQQHWKLILKWISDNSHIPLYGPMQLVFRSKIRILNLWVKFYLCWAKILPVSNFPTNVPDDLSQPLMMI